MTWEITVISSTIYQSLINKIWNIIWISNHGSEIFLFALAIYGVSIIILWSIHNAVKKHYKNNKQKYFLSCDEIIATFAHTQYTNKYPENINTTLIEAIFESKTKDYFLEKNIFENKVKEIEIKIWKTIIDQTQRNNFYKYYNMTKWSMIFSKTIWWILTIITAWVYRIFM